MKKFSAMCEVPPSGGAGIPHLIKVEKDDVGKAGYILRKATHSIDYYADFYFFVHEDGLNILREQNIRFQQLPPERIEEIRKIPYEEIPEEWYVEVYRAFFAE